MDKKIEYKLVIELDDEKLDKDNYDVADTYRIVREVFDKNKDLYPVQNDDGLIIYISYDGAKHGNSGIGGGGVRLFRSWLRPYIKRMEWYDYNDGSIENMLEIFEEYEKKYSNK